MNADLLQQKWENKLSKAPSPVGHEFSDDSLRPTEGVNNNKKLSSQQKHGLMSPLNPKMTFATDAKTDVSGP